MLKKKKEISEVEKQEFIDLESIEEEEEIQEEFIAQKKETLEERRRRLKDLSVKLNNPEAISHLENQPAYLRRNVELDDLKGGNKGNVLSIHDDDE